MWSTYAKFLSGYVIMPHVALSMNSIGPKVRVDNICSWYSVTRTVNTCRTSNISKSNSP
jgi:hypothetical protein